MITKRHGKWQMADGKWTMVCRFFTSAIYFLPFSMLYFVAPAQAATYSVAKTGNDSNPCTPASPCLTISHAYSLASAGDIVIVGAGTYSEKLNLNRGGSAGNLITVQGFPVGASCPTTAQTDAISPVKTRPNPSVSIQSASLSAPYNTLDCFRLTASGASISASNVKLLDNYMDGTTMPIGGTYGSTGVNIDNGTTAGPSNLTVSHNYITLTAYGFLIRATNSIFTDNEVNGLQYGGTTGDCDYNRLWGDRDTFRHNYYHGFNSATMCVAAQPHVDCWQTFINSGSGDYSTNHTFDGNTCLSFNEGFMASNTAASNGAVSGWTVTNNVFDVGNMGPWCGVFDGQGFTVSYNNNTCYGGLVVSRDSWGSGSAHVTALGNIFDIPGWYSICPYYSESGGTTSGSTNNIDYDPGYTLSCNSGDHQGVNPGVVSPGSDYHLKSGSPAIGAGTNVGLTSDHDGNPRPGSNGYDIGAYQYISGSGINPPVITSSTTATGVVGSSFTYQITATNSPSSYNATGLPAGLTVNTGTGLISGIPTAAGTTNVTLSATNAGRTGTASLTITINNTAAGKVYFVRAGATGNGTSWANAWGNLNNIAWSSLNPGDTVCVAGGTYSGSISTGKDGASSSSPITVKRATVSDATCGSGTAGWSSAYDSQAVIGGITVNNNYVTIDGGAWAGGVQWSGGFFITQANSDGSGVSVGGATSNVTLRYIEVSGPCPPSGCNQNADTRGINLDYWTGSSWAAATNWLVQDVNLHGQCTLFIEYNAPNLIVEHSRFADSIDNTPGNPNCHPNVFEDGGITNGVFRYNEVTNWQVEGIMACPNGGCTSNMAIYGNVWHDPNGGSVARVLEAQYNANGPYLLYNNTFVNLPFAVANTANGGTFASGSQGRNNIYWNSAGPGLPSDDYDYSNSSLSESHGQGSAVNPFVNAGVHTVAGYNLANHTNAGLNLGTPYNIDYNGKTRTTWDRGAFEFTGGSPPPAPVITSSTSATGMVGTAFSYQITATNSPSSYNATGLPGGLSVNTNTGVVSGTPSTAGTSNVTISATNANGTGSATLFLTINPAPNPVPTLTSLVPSSTTAGGSAFTLTVNGSKFLSSSTVRWNGSSRTTTFVSANRLTASILAADIATAGSASVTVFNPAPGGGTSNSLTFTINGLSGNPPAINSPLTSSGTVGVAYSYQITATNSPTSFNATGLPAGLSVNAGNGLITGTLTTAGNSNVTISATNANGTGSATLFLTINPAPNPVPTLTSLVPSSTTAGGSAFTLTVNGSKFLSSSTVRWNGSSRTTTFVSATRLTASILAADIATAGSASVTVFNPAPGGGTSNSLTFTINGVSGNPPAINSPLTSSGTVGVAYSYQITATNSPSSYNATGLPGGLSVNTNTGVVSGTPSTAGTSNVTISATNAFGTGNATLVLTIGNAVVPPPALPTPTLNLPQYLAVNGTLMAGYPSGYNVSYQWSITQVSSQQQAASSGVPGSPLAPRLLARASAANFQTPSNTAPLASYSLVPGNYVVTVQAMDGSGNTSAQAQANVTLVAADLSGVKVYPNPWRADKHMGRSITFDNLTVNSTVKIFTVSGHHVKTLPTSSTKITWDLTNDSGDKVASGLYVYLITTDSGQKKTGKIGVIK